MASYSQEWHKPNSNRRHIIHDLIMLSIIDLKDKGYSINFNGWIKSSTYLKVWISSKKMGKEIDASSVEIKNAIDTCDKVMSSFKLRMVKVTEWKYEINLLYEKEVS